MKRHLTTTEYDELKELITRILTATGKEELDAHIKAFDMFRNNGGYIGSVKSILNELYASLNIMSHKLPDSEHLSYFTFTDTYLGKLKEFVRTDNSTH